MSDILIDSSAVASTTSTLSGLRLMTDLGASSGAGNTLLASVPGSSNAALGSSLSTSSASSIGVSTKNSSSFGTKNYNIPAAEGSNKLSIYFGLFIGLSMVVGTL